MRLQNIRRLFVEDVYGAAAAFNVLRATGRGIIVQLIKV